MLEKQSKVYGFVGWDDVLHYAPLAKFGLNTPSSVKGHLICVDPSHADCVLTNRFDLKGNIALIERGGCTFVEKAIRAQEAGAIGMIVANFEKEHSKESFTMGEIEKDEGLNVIIPCVMLSFEKTQKLLMYVHRLNDAFVSIDLLGKKQASLAAAQEREYDKNPNTSTIESLSPSSLSSLKHATGTTWGKFLTSSSAFINKNSFQEVTFSDQNPIKEISSYSQLKLSKLSSIEKDTSIEQDPPTFTFLRWATTSDCYMMHYAPLADFGKIEWKDMNQFQDKEIILCNPIKADSDLLNSTEISNKIVLVERGKVDFPKKITRIQQANGIGVIVANNDVQDMDAVFVMSVDHLHADHITIPSVMISQRIYQLLIQDLPSNISLLKLNGQQVGNLLSHATGTYSLHYSSLHQHIPEQLPSLHDACRRGIDVMVSEILSHGVDVNAYDNDHFQPLHHACINGNVNIVLNLLKHHSDVNGCDFGLQTPLHYSSMSGNIECIECLLSYDVHVNVLNIGKMSPLHYISRIGNAHGLELLMMKSFHGINQQDLNGKTPLHYACEYGHAECALYLIAAHAYIYLKDKEQQTCFTYACKAMNLPGKSETMLQVIEKMLSNEYEVKSRNEYLENIDLIQSKIFRREVEIIYLRKSCQFMETKNLSLQQQVEHLNNTMKEYVGEHITSQYYIKEAKEEREELKMTIQHQKIQIEQLQNQMTSFLSHVNASSLLSSSSLSSHVALENEDEIILGLRKIKSNENDQQSSNQYIIKEESELAEEAALARDIGKKYLRNQNYMDAIKYFQKSLTLLPLPGVSTLLQKTQQFAQEEEEILFQKEKKHKIKMTKDKLIQQYDQMLEKNGVSKEMEQVIENEINNLKQLQEDSTEYALAQEWLNWLISLPLSSCPTSSLGITTFTRLKQEEINSKQEKAIPIIQKYMMKYLRSKHQAACCIQHFFKEHIIHQAIMNENCLLHHEEEEDGHEEEETDSNHGSYDSESENNNDDNNNNNVIEDVEEKNNNNNNNIAYNREKESGNEIMKKKEFNSKELTQFIDPIMFSIHKENSFQFIRGIKLVLIPDLKEEEVKEKFYILQIVCKKENWNTMEESEDYYVWNRWGDSLNLKSQSMLKGPYDWIQALREFERKYKEKTGNAYQVTKQNFITTPTCYKPESWPCDLELTKSISSMSIESFSSPQWNAI